MENVHGFTAINKHPGCPPTSSEPEIPKPKRRRVNARNTHGDIASIGALGVKTKVCASSPIQTLRTSPKVSAQTHQTQVGVVPIVGATRQSKSKQSQRRPSTVGIISTTLSGDATLNSSEETWTGLQASVCRHASSLSTIAEENDDPHTAHAMDHIFSSFPKDEWLTPASSRSSVDMFTSSQTVGCVSDRAKDVKDPNLLRRHLPEPPTNGVGLEQDEEAQETGLGLFALCAFYPDDGSVIPAPFTSTHSDLVDNAAVASEESLHEEREPASSDYGSDDLSSTWLQSDVLPAPTVIYPTPKYPSLQVKAETEGLMAPQRRQHLLDDQSTHGHGEQATPEDAAVPILTPTSDEYGSICELGELGEQATRQSTMHDINEDELFSEYGLSDDDEELLNTATMCLNPRKRLGPIDYDHTTPGSSLHHSPTPLHHDLNKSVTPSRDDDEWIATSDDEEMIRLTDLIATQGEVHALKPTTTANTSIITPTSSTLQRGFKDVRVSEAPPPSTLIPTRICDRAPALGASSTTLLTYLRLETAINAGAEAARSTGSSPSSCWRGKLGLMLNTKLRI